MGEGGKVGVEGGEKPHGVYGFVSCQRKSTLDPGCHVKLIANLLHSSASTGHQNLPVCWVHSGWEVFQPC